MIPFYVCLSISIIFIILELFFAFIENEKMRKIFKPFRLLGIIACLISFGVDEKLLYISLSFALIGDVILIFKKNKICFLFGMISFFAGHIVYIALFASLLTYRVLPWIIVGFTLFGSIFTLSTYKSISQYTKKLTIPGLFYLYILLLETLFATLLLMDSGSLYALFILGGNIIFVVSDLLIAISYFVVDFKRRDFYIMLTYIIAQIMIVIGVIMIL